MSSKCKHQIESNIINLMPNSMRLNNACRVFQAELLAKGGISWLLIADFSFKGNIAILSDSQAAIQALDSATTTSMEVEESRNSLSTFSENHNVTLIWVPGHRNIEWMNWEEGDLP